MNRTILITGASGFTGQHLIAAANERDYRCVAVVKEEGDEVPGAHENFVAELLNPAALESALRETKPDYIVHLAAKSFVANDDIHEIYRVNQFGTINLLNAAREFSKTCKKIVIASSANIYGNSTKLPITEATPVGPVNHYGISKRAMELAAGLYKDLPIVIARPFNYTGRGQGELFLIPKIVGAFRSKQSSIELGNLDVSRDFSDVRDVVSAYLALLELECKGAHRVYNICSGASTSLSSIVSSLEEIAGRKISVEVNPIFCRSDEIKNLYGSPEYLISEIGEFRKHKITETLEWMLNE